MIIMAKTKYTVELLKKFARFNLTKSTGWVVFYIVIELLLLGSVTSLVIYASATDSFAELSFYIFSNLLILLSSPATLIVLPSLFARSSHYLNGVVNTYLFTDSEVIVESTSPSMTEQARANYELFERIFETNDMFYLFITKQQAFLVQKDDLVGGTALDLRNMIQKSAASNRYIIRSAQR